MNRELRKQRFIDYIVANPFATYADIERDLHMGDAKIGELFRDKEVQAEIRGLNRLKFEGMETQAIEKLKEKLDANDWKAIQYILDYCGFKATEKMVVSETKVEVNVD